MAFELGQYTLAIDGTGLPDKQLIGGKAWSIARMRALGLSVPPAFVITARACSAYLAHGAVPDGLDDELARGIAWLEEASGCSFGDGSRPLLVSVRSGAAISMPGMMDTVLNLGITDATEAALAAATGDARFARDTHRRFLDLYGRIVLKAVTPELDEQATPAGWRKLIEDAAGAAVPIGAIAYGAGYLSQPQCASTYAAASAPRSKRRTNPASAAPIRRCETRWSRSSIRSQ